MQYQEATLTKVKIYFACNYLYSKGLSHPQVVEVLSRKISDRALIENIADKAQVDLWNKIFTKAQELTSAGATFAEIVTVVKPMEEDNEVVLFICNAWYAVQTEYMENFVESSGNIYEGGKGVIIASIVLGVAFYADLSIIGKVFWSIIWVLSLIIWLYGLWQKRLANRLDKILTTDYLKYKGFL